MRVRTMAAASTAALAVALTATPAQAAGNSARATSYGPYDIVVDFNGKCMDVAYGGLPDGVPVQIWDCHGGPPVKWRLDHISTVNGWRYYQFVNMNSGKCLDAPGTGVGVPLQQWTCWTGNMQQWALISAPNNSFTIRNLRSGLCVDVTGWGGIGTRLQQWHCNNLTVQTWKYRR
ncbi:RICIN domain-containing protein [Streptomyces sp. NPDC057638]|uniref:RICIN domain-containing protein n=1 Tax=Streptomyces sp. NPDC057638 TaxID=3346190 RepID=UPI0036B2EE39